jgi:uncharacterized protein YcgI (DUF1989 family)
MPDDHRILSPARRGRRCVAGVTVCFFLATGTGAANEWARANVFLSTGPKGIEQLYYHPPLSKPGHFVALIGDTPLAKPSAAPATLTLAKMPGDVAE